MGRSDQPQRSCNKRSDGQMVGGSDGLRLASDHFLQTVLLRDWCRFRHHMMWWSETNSGILHICGVTEGSTDLVTNPYRLEGYSGNVSIWPKQGTWGQRCVLMLDAMVVWWLNDMLCLTFYSFDLLKNVILIEFYKSMSERPTDWRIDRTSEIKDSPGLVMVSDTLPCCMY